MNKHLFLLLAFTPVLLASSEQKVCFNKITAPKVSAAETKCLAVMIYGEARGESKQGMVAVGYTALNRATKSTLCKVVLAPKQYSIFNNNHALQAVALSKLDTPTLKNSIDAESWESSVEVANLVASRAVSDPTHGSTHYLAPTVMNLKKYKYPRWSKEYTLVKVIDNHRFYKLPSKKDNSYVVASI